MRKIDLTNYKIVIHREGIDEIIDFKVKESIMTVLFAPQLKLNGITLLQQQVLFEKISKTEDSFIYVEEEEYLKIKKAFEVYEGFGRESVELVNRIFNAEIVDIQHLQK